MEGFDFNASPKLPAAQIRELAALRWLHAGESVIPFGPVGVGKTHVAQALGTWPSARAPTSASRRPAGSWPSSPAATRTAPGTGACARSSAPTC
ncbi:ATP-binding protein [Streptomyces sp. NPDC057686]|uniref:ATP-binding protein n=1 Tax=Streptomyces sp. NPDC057686 TaxID=3346212 RepID=UPI0036AF5A0B